MLLTETFDEDKLQGIFDAFAELPYNVVWKATKEKFSNSLTIPSNIHFETWLPQLGVLCMYNEIHRSIMCITLKGKGHSKSRMRCVYQSLSIHEIPTMGEHPLIDTKCFAL